MKHLALLAVSVFLLINSNQLVAENEEYLELLKYEYNNRDFALHSNQKAAKSHAGTPTGDYFLAYAELEAFNQKIFSAMQSPLGYQHKTSLWTRVRAGSVGLALGLTPTRWVKVDKIMKRIVLPYLPKLKRLKELSPPKHIAFFNYVIEQEELQLQAALATADGNWQAGSTILKQFVAQQDEKLITAEQK